MNTKSLIPNSRPQGRPAECWRVAVTLGVLAIVAAVGAEELKPVPPKERDLGKLDLEELGQIKVTTVSRSEATVQDSPAAVYVITQEDIRRSGVTSIPEALRLAPGVNVARIDSTGGRSACAASTRNSPTNCW